MGNAAISTDLTVSGAINVDSGTLFVNQEYNRVGIGTTNPSGKMEVAGQYLSSAYSNGSSGSAITVNWDNANVQTVTANANCTYTLSQGIAGGRYMLIITQDATGSRTYSWSVASGSVKWPASTSPTGSGASKVDVITFCYDGTNFYGGNSLNY